MRDKYEEEYIRLGNLLPEIYTKDEYQNHCFWRIALDNAIGNKWDLKRLKIQKPAYKNIPLPLLQRAVIFLTQYQTDQELLEEHDLKSLRWRKKI